MGNICQKAYSKLVIQLSKRFFRPGQSRFIEGAQSDVSLESSKSILRLDLQTILCSPLITDGNKIGVIYVDSKYLHKIKEKKLQVHLRY